MLTERIFTIDRDFTSAEEAFTHWREERTVGMTPDQIEVWDRYNHKYAYGKIMGVSTLYQYRDIPTDIDDSVLPSPPSGSWTQVNLDAIPPGAIDESQIDQNLKDLRAEYLALVAAQ